MESERKNRKGGRVFAISGGADSVYLAYREAMGARDVLAHYNHRARGEDSDADESFCRGLAEELGSRAKIGRAPSGGATADPGRTAFEETARRQRHAFLKSVMGKSGADSILMAHTADDQVETILMRFLEGTGIAGLKGIPLAARDGVCHPILDVWRVDILKYLKRHNRSFRIDRTNFDTRYERNWIRHVLIPLLVGRYGAGVKKRIHVMGERFREIDDYIEGEAARWIGRNMRTDGPGSPYPCRFPRKAFSRLPSVLRVRILQKICFERLELSPNERLLRSMENSIATKGPSARIDMGKGIELRCVYGDFVFARARTDSWRGRKRAAETAGNRGGRTKSRNSSPGTMIPLPTGIPGGHSSGIEKGEMDLPGLAGGRTGSRLRDGASPARLTWVVGGRRTPGQVMKTATEERGASFDRERLSLPLRVRPLRAGDRIRPFGMDGEKKVKDVLIDKKVPRDERWGRPVICDANGTVLWIPDVVRSVHAPVTPSTKKTVVFRLGESS